MDRNKSSSERQCFRAAEKSPDGKAEVIICEVDFLSTSRILSWAFKVVELENIVLTILDRLDVWIILCRFDRVDLFGPIWTVWMQLVVLSVDRLHAQNPYNCSTDVPIPSIHANDSHTNKFRI